MLSPSVYFVLFLHTLRNDVKVKYLTGYMASKQAAYNLDVGSFHLLDLP